MLKGDTLQPGSLSSEPGSSTVFVPAVDHGHDGFLGHGRDGFLARDTARVRSICHHKQDFVLRDIEILQQQQSEDNASLNRQVGDRLLNDLNGEGRRCECWCHGVPVS